MSSIQSRMETLLGTWCDSLVSSQLLHDSEGLNGGFLCPACARMHGRSADAIYPLLHRYSVTRSEKYLTAAIHVADWAAFFDCPDGSFVNDTDSTWQGITVFSAIAWGEALRHHGDLLPKYVRDKWQKRLEGMANFLDSGFFADHGPINYPASNALALYILGDVLHRDDLKQKALPFAENALAYVAEDFLLYGESENRAMITPRGTRAIDIGYNVEESLPNLALYAHLSGNEPMLARIAEIFSAHLCFMLPDGAWDNSVGSRMIKWTYWGSRTSDGAQAGLLLLAKYNPAFIHAAELNLSLYENCTHGLLYGGLHLKDMGEPPCIHHTFTHAKALATCLDMNLCGGASDTPIPREKEGIMYFPSMQTYLIGTGPWHATVNANDIYRYPKGNHPGGGSLTMLWCAGKPVLCSSVTEYAMVEPNNMQRHRGRMEQLTPRVEADIAGEIYQSTVDPDAVLNAEITGTHSSKTYASGILMTPSGVQPAISAHYVMEWNFSETIAEAHITCEGNDRRFILPIIAAPGSKTQITGNTAIITDNDRMIKVTVPCGRLSHDGSIFHHTPGFHAILLVISFDENAVIQIEVEKKAKDH